MQVAPLVWPKASWVLGHTSGAINYASNHSWELCYSCNLLLSLHIHCVFCLKQISYIVRCYRRKNCTTFWLHHYVGCWSCSRWVSIIRDNFLASFSSVWLGELNVKTDIAIWCRQVSTKILQILSEFLFIYLETGWLFVWTLDSGSCQ